MKLLNLAARIQPDRMSAVFIRREEGTGRFIAQLAEGFAGRVINGASSSTIDGALENLEVEVVARSIPPACPVCRAVAAINCSIPQCPARKMRSQL